MDRLILLLFYILYVCIVNIVNIYILLIDSQQKSSKNITFQPVKTYFSPAN